MSRILCLTLALLAVTSTLWSAETMAISSGRSRAGQLDELFGAAWGNVSQAFGTKYAPALAVQSDGGMIAIRSAENEALETFVVRLRSKMDDDPAFAPARLSGTNQHVTSLLCDRLDRIVIAGGFDAVDGVPRPGVARLNRNGSLDPSFEPALPPVHTDGVAFPSRFASVLPDGELMIVHINGDEGSPHPLAGARMFCLDPNGALKSSGTIHVDANEPLPWPMRHGMFGQRGGKLIVVGGGLNLRTDRPAEAKSLIVRLTPEGVLDASFHQATFGLPVPNAFLAPDEITVTDALMYPDGKILLSGSFGAVDGHPSTNLVRLLPDGQPDRSFTSEWAFDSVLSLESSGRVFAASGSRLVRLLPDGTLDATFGPVNLSPIESALFRPGDACRIDPASIVSLHAEPGGGVFASGFCSYRWPGTCTGPSFETYWAGKPFWVRFHGDLIGEVESAMFSRITVQSSRVTFAIVGPAGRYAIQATSGALPATSWRNVGLLSLENGSMSGIDKTASTTAAFYRLKKLNE